MIYKLSIPRKNSKYTERVRVYLLQCFGRNISEQDKSKFKEKIAGIGYNTRSKELYDDAIAISIDS